MSAHVTLTVEWSGRRAARADQCAWRDGSPSSASADRAVDGCQASKAGAHLLVVVEVEVLAGWATEDWGGTGRGGLRPAHPRTPLVAWAWAWLAAVRTCRGAEFRQQYGQLPSHRNR